ARRVSWVSLARCSAPAIIGTPPDDLQEDAWGNREQALGVLRRRALPRRAVGEGEPGGAELGRLLWHGQATGSGEDDRGPGMARWPARRRAGRRRPPASEAGSALKKRRSVQRWTVLRRQLL